MVRMFKQFLEVFWPKAVEYVVDQGLNSFKNMKDFELILETLQKNMKLLSAKASDLEEEIKSAEDSGRKKMKREVKEWLEEVKSIETEVEELGGQAESQGFVMRFVDGRKAAQLNEQVEKLLQQASNFGEPLLDARGTREDTLLTNEMVGEAFHGNLEKNLELLKNRQVSKIGVYGMSGVGKTTLAKHVYNQLVQEYEGRVVWVTVSHEFTIKSLQDKIARFLGVKLEDEDEEAFRATRLDRFLSDKKISVLILDDVWENIDMKRVGCNFSAECCRLIVTTRSSKVCHQIECQEIIKVEKLRKDEAWKLFNGTLGRDMKLSPQVEEIAKSMAKLCDGLPLGIITVAGSMKGETTIHSWHNALAELRDRIAGGQDDMVEVDEVFTVLKYSFDRLNRNDGSGSNELNMIQHCFVYCSLYPEDYVMVREDLVRKFISDGLLDQRTKRIAQVELGLSILDKLVNVCLLERCVDSDGKECVKMHDLVRGMAMKIGEGKYVMVRMGNRFLEEIYAPNEEEWIEGLEKVSLTMCDQIRRIEDGISLNCPNLSTLLLWENRRLEVIPDSFFSKIQGLCTLDLCRNARIEILPNSITELTRLKALLLEDCLKLAKVPYLGKLKALRELNLSRTAIEEAPQGLEELLSLRFFSIDAPKLKMLPRGVLLKLEHLQHLNLPLHLQVDIDEIKNLKQVEEFGGIVKNVSAFNWFITTCGVHEYDICYKIGVTLNSAPLLRYGKREYLVCDKNELVLCECNLKDEKVLGRGIVYLTIRECEGLSKCFVDDLAPRFDNPTSLRKLKISKCGGIGWILRSDCQISNTLEEIGLFELHDLKGILVMERGEIAIGPSTTAPTQPALFSSLKRLIIGYCTKTKKVGLPVNAIPNLENISIWGCVEMEEIFEEDERTTASTLPALPKLTNLKLIGLPRLKKVGIALSGVPNLETIHIWGCGEIDEILKEDEGIAASTLTKLKWLILSDLPRLKSVSKATIISNSIEYINITKCPRLMNKLPVHFENPTPPPSLRRIDVEREWWETLEWDSPNVPRFLQSFLIFV